MARCRFVQPDVVRVPLSEGEFIDVKRELNAGEQRRVFSGLVKDMTFGEKAILDPQLVGKTKVVEYLVGWSFLDANGSPVAVSDAALDNLDEDTYSEIVAAIDAHEAKSHEAREKKRTSPATVNVSAPTSPSAD